MIYAKIYLETNGDLVIDSVKEDVEGFIEICQKKKQADGSYRIVPMTEIKPSTNVVCSQEAKQMLKILLDPKNPNLTVSKFDGELALFRNNTPLYRDSGLRFCFRPDKLGETKKTIKPNGKIYLSVEYGLDYDVLDDFKIADNEFIQTKIKPSGTSPNGFIWSHWLIRIRTALLKNSYYYYVIICGSDLGGFC